MDGRAECSPLSPHRKRSRWRDHRHRSDRVGGLARSIASVSSPSYPAPPGGHATDARGVGTEGVAGEPMTPFTYPSAPLVRRHGPVGYLDTSSFRPWLRDEFGFRCVYCLRRERWEPDLGVFEIDHFAPVSQSPDLRVAYW